MSVAIRAGILHGPYALPAGAVTSWLDRAPAALADLGAVIGDEIAASLRQMPRETPSNISGFRQCRR